MALQEHIDAYHAKIRARGTRQNTILAIHRDTFLELQSLAHESCTIISQRLRDSD